MKTEFHGSLVASSLRVVKATKASFFRLLISVVRVFLISQPLWLAASSSAADGPPSQPGHYFLVIDHSGSMLRKVAKGPESGKSRWELMRERSADFVQRLPPSAEVWAAIFDAKISLADKSMNWERTFTAKLDSDKARSDLVASLRGFPEPAPANGTWLYAAEDDALAQVELAGARDPNAYLTVMVYTDGHDEGFGQTASEIQQHPASPVDGAHIEARIKALHRKFRNFNLVKVFQETDESIRDAQVLRLVTNRLQLANPLITPHQEADLEFSFRDDDRLKLAGRPLTLSLEGEDGRPLPLRLGGGPFTLTNGRVHFTIDRSGDWPAGKDVVGRIRVGYPAISDVFLVAEGGDAVDVLIQGAEAPDIGNLLPSADSVFPVNRSVSFSLTTLPGATVNWDFGDGSASAGNPVSHTFSTPGKRNVTVVVTDPKTHLTKRQTLGIGIEHLAVALDPLPGNAVPGTEVTLTASADGAFQHFEWNVGGRIFAGGPRADGRPGTMLTFTPERPGNVPISLSGDGTNGGHAEAQPANLAVKAVPALRVTSPASDDALYYGSSREFRAEVEGVDANRLRFTLLDGSGSALIQPREVDVHQEGSVRVAVLPQKIPVLPGAIKATLRVEAIGAGQLPPREVPVSITREPVMIEIKLPEGREPAINRAASIELRTNTKLEGIQWDFGDGQGPVDGSEITTHTWTHYGDYRLNATARDPDGNPVAAATVDIHVPIRPVSVRAGAVVDGKMVGAEVKGVSSNATVELRPEVTGDVTRLRWYMNGKELPPNVRTVVASGKGVMDLRVVAEGTPEAGNSESSMSIRLNDRLLFVYGTVAVILLLCLAGWLLLGNQPRHYRFAVVTRGLTPSSTGPDADPRTLYKLRSTDVPCGRWDFFGKKAIIEMRSLDNNLKTRQLSVEDQDALQGFGEWQDTDRLEFKDLHTIKVRGERLLDAVESARLTNFDTHIDDPYRIRYTIPRPRVRQGNPYATLQLYLEERKVPFVTRYLCEMLFALLVLGLAYVELILQRRFW